MNEEILSSIKNQLWRYYDIDLDVHTVELIKTVNDSSCAYKIFGDSDEFVNLEFRIMCKMFNSKVENLYLHDGTNYVSPTTTLEEQAAR